jgi:DedD protein
VNDILKQRLVGALILIALGVVFWPIIFVEPGDQSATPEGRIPPRPGVSTVPLEPPDMAGLRTSPPRTVRDDPPVPVQPEKTATAQPEQAPPKRTRTEPPAKLEIDSDGVPVAWVLQVASVSSAEKANELRQRLMDMGEKADVRKVRSGGKNLYRVYLGPKFERASLEAIQPQVDKQFGVKSIVARFIP